MPDSAWLVTNVVITSSKIQLRPMVFILMVRMFRSLEQAALDRAFESIMPEEVRRASIRRCIRVHVGGCQCLVTTIVACPEYTVCCMRRSFSHAIPDSVWRARRMQALHLLIELHQAKSNHDDPKGTCCGNNILIQWLLEVLAVKRSGLRTLVAVYFQAVEPTVPSLACHVRSPSYACILRSGHIGLVLLAYALRFLLRPEQWRT